MGRTTDHGADTARTADGQEEQTAGPETPPTSPRIEEVAKGNPVREALAQAEAERRHGTFGKPGRPLNPNSPFLIGMKATAGVLTVIALAELLLKARSVLILIGLAFFIAAGLDPVVVWLTRHGLRRWMAVVVVLLALLALVGGFIAAAIPPVASQTATLIRDLPHYAQELQNHNSTLGRLNDKYHLQQRLSTLLSSKGSELVGGVIGAGQIVISTVSSIVLVGVMTIYFLAGMPATKLFFYRMVPHSRRPRAILLVDEIFTKVGGYVLGNVITSFIAGFGTFLWMLAFGIPYPALLGLLVFLLDLIPVIGSTVGGIIVTLVALTVSLPVAIATLAFYVVYRLAEDYLLVPRIIGRTVRVPALAGMVAIVLGGVVMGIIGALIALPVAAAIQLLLEEITFRRLDNS
ncbi:MAG TPA: AI-2E family transporter [Trebonia sp.]|nr:AI-2E family transporter [Trebonia sp.]